MNYTNEIRKDIAKEFGLEAAGYAPSKSSLTFSQAMYLNAKYPNSDEYSLSPSDKAFAIAIRYTNLKKAWSK
jgi:hypothetical protein